MHIPCHMHTPKQVLKDIFNRFRLLQGHRVHFTPGWDTHGLPIELKATEALRASGAIIKTLIEIARCRWVSLHLCFHPALVICMCVCCFPKSDTHGLLIVKDTEARVLAVLLCACVCALWLRR
jgi:hypothetical protein